MIIQSVNWQTHRDALIRIRHSVFIDKQGISEKEEWDEHDETALHILVTLLPPPEQHSPPQSHPDHKTQHINNSDTLTDNAIACARLVMHANGDIQIGRVAVLALYRHKGIATAMVKHAIMTAWQHSYPVVPTIYLNAQNNLVNMYQKLHFTPEGDTFLDAGMPHTRMQFATDKIKTTTFFNRQSLEINNPNGFACLARLLTQLTVRRICILSDKLAPALYHKSDLCDALSLFVRSHRQAHIDIAVANTRTLGQSRHALVELSKRIPSKIRIQKVQKGLLDTGNITVNQDILTFDNTGFITLLNSQMQQGFGVFNNKVHVKQAQNHFDYIWQNHCETEPNIRQIY